MFAFFIAVAVLELMCIGFPVLSLLEIDSFVFLHCCAQHWFPVRIDPSSATED
jgi:hypothetical protein